MTPENNVFGTGGSFGMKWNLLGWKCCQGVMELREDLERRGYRMSWTTWSPRMGWMIAQTRVNILTSGQFLTITDAPRSFAYRSLWKGSGRAVGYVLILLDVWAERDLNHKCGSSWFVWTLRDWLTVGTSIDWITSNSVIVAFSNPDAIITEDRLPC